MVPRLDPAALSSSARGPDGGGAHGHAAAAAAPWLRARGLRVVSKFWRFIAGFACEKAQRVLQFQNLILKNQ